MELKLRENEAPREVHTNHGIRALRLSPIEYLRALFVFCALLMTVGCGGGLDLGSVSGRVTKNGQPQQNLWVRFVPAAGGRPAEAITDQDGKYELSYTGNKKGALVGPQKVAILSGGEIDGRGNELSPRKEIYRTEVDVASGSNEFDFQIAPSSESPAS